MGRREDIENMIWADPDFQTLSPPAKLVYLWSFTNPLCGMSGIYKISVSRIAFDTGLTARKVEDALAELQQSTFVYYVDGVLWVRSRVKRLRTRTVQIAKSIARDLSLIPAEHPLLAAFLYVYGDSSWLREQIPLEQRESVNLTRTSPEPGLKDLGQGPGSGLGTGVVNDPSSNVGGVPLRLLTSDVNDFGSIEHSTNGEAA